MAELEEIRNDVMNYVKKEFINDENDINYDTPLISGGIVDSFSMISLKRFLERKYKISIPNAKASAEAFDTVNKITDLVGEFLEIM